MAQESICKVAIVGAGACGCACAAFLKDSCEVTLFDFSKPLRTLLPTGGGRCNFAHAEFDFKELASNYPRGEKFLYSVFSKFSTADTLAFFDKLGIEYYFQDDGRIFPKSDSAVEVRNKILGYISDCEFKKEKVLRVNKKDKLEVVTDCGSYLFDKVIVTTGGHNGYNIAKYLGIDVVEPKPALVGLKTEQKVSELAGVVLKGVDARFGKFSLTEDLLFTHRGISGPLAYKISSIMAREKMPYEVCFQICPEFDLQEELNSNPHKNIVNLLSEFVPKSFGGYLLDLLCIDSETKCHNINGVMRDKILDNLYNFTLKILATEKEGEVVTAGGVSLSEINPKTFECKKVPNLYFGGEVLDIDGFCGGFNLQNCWSDAFVIAEGVKE